MGTAVGFLNQPVRTKFSLTMEPPQKWVRPRAATDRSETWLFLWEKIAKCDRSLAVCFLREKPNQK